MGNICRSPTAEGVVRARLERTVSKLGPGIEIELDSAGTHGYHVGQPPDRRAVDAARRRGIDLSTIRSRKVTDEDFEAFDLILAMDRDNLAHLEELCPPDLKNRLGLYMAFAADAALDEVPDPYYGGLNGFDRVLDLVEEAADGLVEEIMRRQPSKIA